MINITQEGPGTSTEGVGDDFAPPEVLHDIPTLGLIGDEIEPDSEVVFAAKWFSPYLGWCWYAAECDPDTGICFGYVEGVEKDWGWFDLKELALLRNFGVPAVERDTRFKPITFGDLQHSRVTDQSR